MSKKLTTEDFILRAAATHGDKYDYTLSVYTDSHTHIIIHCKKCDAIFNQTPSGHLRSKSGCPNCSARNISKTLEDFIEEANIVHSNEFDYSISKYVNYHTKLNILHNKCGRLFQQTPASHLKGQGCKECSWELLGSQRKLVLDVFIERARVIHDDKFDYSNVKYFKNSHQKVSILCKKCNKYFSQTINSHLNGTGCASCAGVAKLTLIEFLRRANDIHHDKYNYTSIKEIVNVNTKITILCNKCGLVFTQTPTNHINHSEGCPGCDITNPQTLEKFIIKANAVHHNLYDYSNVIYINCKTKIEIICKTCSLHFTQIPASHINAQSGCPNCSGANISKQERKWLQYIELPDDNKHRQVNLNIDGKKYRVDGFDPSTNTVYEFNGTWYHGHPDFYPADGINTRSKKTYGELYKKTIAREALIQSAGYHLIVMWEHEWKEHQKSIDTRVA